MIALWRSWARTGRAGVNKHVSLQGVSEREQRQGEGIAKASLARAPSYSVAAK